MGLEDIYSREEWRSLWRELIRRAAGDSQGWLDPIVSPCHWSSESSRGFITRSRFMDNMSTLGHSPCTWDSRVSLLRRRPEPREDSSPEASCNRKGSEALSKGRLQHLEGSTASQGYGMTQQHQQVSNGREACGHSRVICPWGRGDFQKHKGYIRLRRSWLSWCGHRLVKFS